MGNLSYDMKLIILYSMLGLISIASSLPAKDGPQNQDKVDNIQAKRDLSLSYAATDIGSKEGTRVKTITVIKNVIGKKDKPLKIDPKLHKDDDWGSHFRDNFDAYGAIPDVPDIDELFDFVNKKGDKKPKEDDPSKQDEPANKKEETDEGESKENSNDSETPSSPAPVEEVVNEEKVEKITGDAEVIDSGNKPNKVKSQSLDLGKYKVKETIDEDYRQLQSNPSTHKRNGKYIQSSSIPYYYPEPNPSYPGSPNAFPPPNAYNSPQSQKSRGSVSVSTPSGKKFDVPVSNVTDSPPYIAPTVRRNQNSPSGLQFVTSSQRPYIAPNVRKSYEVQLDNSNPNTNCATGSNNTTGNTQQTNLFNYQEIPTNFRSTTFRSIGVNKSNAPRSRGLRY